MPIHALPQFEADLEQDRREREEYERLKPPTTIVVRFGVMRLIGEYPYDGPAKPGCGSKLVARTHRGTELAEMLTSTCPNSGCGHSVSRKQILEYIQNSGGEDYPFHTQGRILRVATIEDLNEQRRLDGLRRGMVRAAQARADDLKLPMVFVEAESILGGERATFYFRSEERVDFRELVHVLAREFGTRIELRQVGARDEARLVADYERCGQHCCCRQFLKVLKPVSMKSAKVQKATLDPLKISGRCGRLMCCLRYEDQTYDELLARLPKLRSRVGTTEGPGIVVDRQILTQLVRVQLEGTERQIAVPVENLIDPEEAARIVQSKATPPPENPLRGMSPDRVARKVGEDAQSRQDDFRRRSRRDDSPAPGAPRAERPRGGPSRPERDAREARNREARRSWEEEGRPEQRASRPPRQRPGQTEPASGSDAGAAPDTPPRDHPEQRESQAPSSGRPPAGDRRRRKRRRRRGGGGHSSGPSGPGPSGPDGPPSPSGQ